MLRNSIENYGSLTKTLHWLNAILIIGMLALGFILTSITGENPSPWQIKLINLHKSVGLTILLLILFQLVWRMVNIRPALPLTIPLWQQTASKTAHLLLYLTVFLMAVSGWLMVSFAGKPAFFWGWINVALPFDANRGLASQFFNIHGWIAWIIIGLVSIHILAALKHHFYDKNYVLRRMLPGIKQYNLSKCSRD